MSGWPLVKLGEICDLYQPETISRKQLNQDGHYVVYGANGPIGSYDRFNHEESEVTMTCRGATCGRINVTPPKVWITGNAMVIRPKSEAISKEFLASVLPHLDLSQTISGTAQPQITRKSLSPLLVPVPPLDEQKRIVAKLDDVTNLAAKASERQKKSVALASQIRKRYLDEAVNNLLEQASLCRLEEVATLIRGPFGGSLKKSMFVDAGFAVYEQKHAIAGDLSGVRYWVDNSKYEEMIRFSIRPGDILMSCSGTIGRVARVQPEDAPGLINQALLLVRPHAIIEPEMLTLLMESEYFQEKVSVGVTGSAMKNVASVRELKKTAIPVPVRSEQLRFIAALADYSSVGSQLHDVAVRRHSLTSSLSARLLESAFAGVF